MATKMLAGSGTGRGGSAKLLEASRSLRAMLDSVEANVFVADLDFTLIYMNRRAAATVRSIESEIQSSFGVAWADMLGGSIHRFHEDRDRVERILHDPSSFPHKASFSFGRITLATTINGVFDDTGTPYGYVVAWDDVTDQAALEAKAQQLAEDLAAASGQLSSVSEQLGASAQQTAAQAGMVSAGAEEMSASINEIAKSTASAATVAQEAVEAASTANTTVTNLGSSSQEITEVVNLINNIASQTNLLALNATIEAARAGEAGRGFAIVANEVKDLARATATATEDISKRIEAIQTDSTAAGGAIERIHAIIGEINDLQNTIASAVEEQAATAGEITSNISGVATAAESTSTGATSIQQSAQDLARSAAELNEIVAKK
jgi:hypothetical protein